MNAGVVFLVIVGSLLLDGLIFFVLIRPLIQRARFIGFLQERGFQIEAGGRQVTRAHGLWEDVPCEIIFNDQSAPKSRFRMQLSAGFPTDAKVRFNPGPEEMFLKQADDLLRQRLRDHELLEIESTEPDAVEALFSGPDVLPPLTQLLRFQSEWTTIEDGRLCYSLPILSRQRNFVTWIFDRMLPLVRALDQAARRSGRTTGDVPSVVREAPLPPEADGTPMPDEPASSGPAASSELPLPDAGLTLQITVERTETTMGFDLPEAYQWGVTLLGVDDAGRTVRVLVLREQSDAVRNLEPGTRRTFAVQPATPGATDGPADYFKM